MFLSDGAEWKIIDPHGYIGDAAAEVGPVMYNPLDWTPHEPLRAVLHRRIEILCDELPFDRHRIHAWSLCQSLLSVAWTCEGSGAIDHKGLAVAEALNKIKM